MTVGYGTAWAAREGIAPKAVVLPGNAAEAGAALRACAEHGCPVVPQGGNTGMVRGGVPVSGDEVVVSTARMEAIEEVDERVAAGEGRGRGDA